MRQHVGRLVEDGSRAGIAGALEGGRLAAVEGQEAECVVAMERLDGRQLAEPAAGRGELPCRRSGVGRGAEDAAVAGREGQGSPGEEKRVQAAAPRRFRELRRGGGGCVRGLPFPLHLDSQLFPPSTVYSRAVAVAIGLSLRPVLLPDDPP
ncbi:MAG: hypothetical protein HY721_03245 [Planctomycetes bacterium]|nr:hypothetical protein [Planctomycetota bacterium]